jgi:hypothetical protein
MNKYLSQVEEKLNLYFGKKAPSMPENIKEFIVKYSPYLSIVMLIFAIPAILISFGLVTFAIPLAYLSSVHTGFTFSITALISLASLVFEAIAIPGLFKRTRQSWQYMFYASLLSLLSYLLAFNIGSLIISGAISFYILFQIKALYKN